MSFPRVTGDEVGAIESAVRAATQAAHSALEQSGRGRQDQGALVTALAFAYSRAARLSGLSYEDVQEGLKLVWGGR